MAQVVGSCCHYSLIAVLQQLLYVVCLELEMADENHMVSYGQLRQGSGVTIDVLAHSSDHYRSSVSTNWLGPDLLPEQICRQCVAAGYIEQDMGCS